MHAHQHAVHSRRLTHPFIRSNGELVPCSWDEAFAVASQHMQRISEQYGADANAVYGGGSLTNETAYLLGKFARVALGTRYIDYNGRFCMSAAASAGSKTFGIDRG